MRRCAARCIAKRLGYINGAKTVRQYANGGMMKKSPRSKQRKNKRVHIASNWKNNCNASERNDQQSDLNTHEKTRTANSTQRGADKAAVQAHLQCVHGAIRMRVRKHQHEKFF